MSQQPTHWSIEELGTTHGTVCSTEHLEAAHGTLERFSRQYRLVDVGDHVPELGVLLVEDDDHAAGLGVEGAGDVLDGLGDELLDA